MSDSENFENFGSISYVGQRTSKPSFCKFIWTIPNFESHSCQVGECYESPLICFGTNEEWTLSIYLNGYDESTKNYVGISTYQYQGDSDNEFIIKLAVLDMDGEKYFNKLVHVPISDDGIEPEYIKKKLLLDKEFGLLTNNELRMFCCIIDLSNVMDGNGGEIKEMSHSQNAHLEDFCKMLNNKKFSDFKLVVKSKEFHVHRAILAARSPVFEAMFESNMRETSEGKTHIEDIEPVIIEKLLRFIYTGQVNLEDLADKILVAADKYQLDSLKLQCENELVKQLSIDNVYDILLIADQTNATSLKKKAVEFFSENLKVLVAAENFTSCMDPLPGSVKTEIIRVMGQKR